jgi:hypothetical protein
VYGYSYIKGISTVKVPPLPSGTGEGKISAGKNSRGKNSVPNFGTVFFQPF